MLSVRIKADVLVPPSYFQIELPLETVPMLERVLFRLTEHYVPCSRDQESII